MREFIAGPLALLQNMLMDILQSKGTDARWERGYPALKIANKCINMKHIYFYS